MNRKHIKQSLGGATRTIQIGRSRNTSGMGSQTPIVVIPDSSEPPRLDGLPYLKTTFSNGRGFSKTLYTPSTLRVIVGENWKYE